MATEDLLVQIAPQFEDDPSIGAFLTMASKQVNATAWGSLYEEGVVYLAAHLMSVRDRNLSNKGAPSGTIQSMKTGTASVTFSNISSAISRSDASLSTTSYGAEFLRMRSLLVTTPILG